MTLTPAIKDDIGAVGHGGTSATNAQPLVRRRTMNWVGLRRGSGCNRQDHVPARIPCMTQWTHSHWVASPDACVKYASQWKRPVPGFGCCGASGARQPAACLKLGTYSASLHVPVDHLHPFPPAAMDTPEAGPHIHWFGAWAQMA
eukprot:CAMPEP_0174319500 /NCGR_PEP_ID=MMETSP0810-20121108/8907_1 /TAXON_ID=73025 ORGANISM="Eutreptiella gymnastica-like, Strain CCMP1594" /NCGR_SAMPLE_ID=MMETSP0810 /ASSEMBLY_ACC=CAM_ASM_000659 /LENGTH=144 /DNA_ID=CAMNT_0015430065 /DNA_START=1031 /DNA_END=1466 /DNA_ORIENTATION=+